jgi:hypothetical protein
MSRAIVRGVEYKYGTCLFDRNRAMVGGSLQDLLKNCKSAQKKTLQPLIVTISPRVDGLVFDSFTGKYH